MRYRRLRSAQVNGRAFPDANGLDRKGEISESLDFYLFRRSFSHFLMHRNLFKIKKMKRSIFYLLFLASLFIFGSYACNQQGTDDEETPMPPTTTEDLPEVFQKFSAAVEIYLDGDEVVLKTENFPNHSSPYFDQSDSRYEAYNGSNPDFNLNPNRIMGQNFTFRVPVNPTEANNKEATRLGAIGIAINGVVFFNQYAGPNNQPLTNEINSFDQYNGHPQNTGVYHYHIEPLYLTEKEGQEAFLGVLLDGFPVYGPMENGQMVRNSDLDEYHGHTHATTEYPEGIYHYHITDEDPYLNGSAYFGTPGTVTN